MLKLELIKESRDRHRQASCRGLINLSEYGSDELIKGVKCSRLVHTCARIVH